MVFDSHAHLNFAAYKNDGKELIEKTLQAGVFFVNVGTNLKTSKEAVKVSEEYGKGIYASVGCHPSHIIGDEEESVFDGEKEIIIKMSKEDVDFDNYRDLIKSSKKVVAIGEVGLDYYRIPENVNINEVKNKQKEILIGFINLAKEFDLPIILHARGEVADPYGVYDELYELVKSLEIKNGVVHCFGGDLNQAEKFMNLGFYIGITGIVTFKKSDVLREIAKELSLDALLIETDSPYLAPDPYRGKRNEPLYVEEVAKKIAAIRGIRKEEVENVTAKSALALFKISV